MQTYCRTAHNPWNQTIKAMRWHTLTGWWLLFCPCWWGWLVVPFPRYWSTLLWMAAGSFWARSLGCFYNDWVDRDVDARVPRTQTRPLVTCHPSGGVWMIVLGFGGIGGGILAWFLPVRCVMLGALGGIGALIYPWLKRITHYPQVFLALIFNIGVWMPAAIDCMPWNGMIWGLYGYGIAWTMSYDTIYAFQDAPWDRAMGIGSLAVALGSQKAPYALGGLLIFRVFLLGFMTSWMYGLLLFVIQTWSLVRVCCNIRSPQVLSHAFHRWAVVEGVLVGLSLIANTAKMTMN